MMKFHEKEGMRKQTIVLSVVFLLLGCTSVDVPEKRLKIFEGTIILNSFPVIKGKEAVAVELTCVPATQLLPGQEIIVLDRNKGELRGIVAMQSDKILFIHTKQLKTLKIKDYDY